MMNFVHAVCEMCLGVLGFSEGKERTGGTEWFEACPVHAPNRGSFSFDVEGRFNSFSCRLHGAGPLTW